VPQPTASVSIAVAEVPAPTPVPSAAPPVADPVEPMPNAGLDEETSAELGQLLDAQLERVSRRRRRELVVTLLLVVGLVGAGIGWFARSPPRVSAFRSALSEIRRVGDIKGMMAKYQVALDKIGTRGKDLDDASLAMGVDPATVKDDDRGLDAETEAFTGEQRTRVSARNTKLQEKFGKVVKSPVMVGKGAAQESPFSSLRTTQ
jgi:hypothetical protein